MPSNFEAHVEGANAYTIHSATDTATVKSPTTPTGFGCVYRVIFGFSGTPTTGLIRVYERNSGDSADSTLLFRVPVTSAGTGPIDINCKALTAGRKLRVELTDTGTAGTTAYINAHFGDENGA